MRLSRYGSIKINGFADKIQRIDAGNDGNVFAVRITNNSLSEDVRYGDVVLIDTALSPVLSDTVLLDLPYIGAAVMSCKNVEHLEMVTGCKFGFIGVVTEIRRRYRDAQVMQP